MSFADKKIAKRSFIYVAIGFLPVAANLVIAPVFTRYLSKEEYAILAMAAIFQGYISVFINLGLTGAFSRYFFKYFTKPKLYKALFSSTLFFIFTFSLVIGAILFFFGENLFNLIFDKSEVFSFSKYGFIVYATAVLIIFQAIALALYRNSEKVKPYAFIAIAAFLSMSVGSIIGVVLYNAGAYGSLAGKLVGLAVVMIPYLIYFFIKNRLIVKISLITQMISYALPLIPYALLGIGMNYLDKQLGERFISLDDLGFYNVAFLIASVPAIFIFAAQSTINPSVFKNLERYKLNNKSQELAEIRNLISYYFVFIFLIFIALILFIVPACNIILGKEFQNVSYYVPLLTIAYVFRAYYVIFSIPIFFENKTKVLPIINLITVIVAGSIGFYIVPKYGIIGLCITFIAMMFLQLITTLLYLNKMNWLQSSVFRFQKVHYLFSVLILTILSSYYINNFILEVTRWFMNVIIVTFSLTFASLLWRKTIINSVYLLKNKLFNK
jgi:O-antigen/teichoic acid export membrane protein